MTSDRLIKWSAVAVVVAVAAIAAVVSYTHALALVEAHGESGAVARMVPLTVDGLIYASSMALLSAARQGREAPALARWLLALGIGVTLAANVAHGLAHGPAGAAVAAWPAVSLVGSYELLMVIIRGAGHPVPEPEALRLPALSNGHGAPEGGREVRGRAVPRGAAERQAGAARDAPGPAPSAGGAVVSRCAYPRLTECTGVPRRLRLARRFTAGDDLGLVGPPGHHGQDGQVLQRDLFRPLVVGMRGHVPDPCERALSEQVESFLA